MEVSAFFKVCEHVKITLSLGATKGISDYGNEHKQFKNNAKYNLALKATANAIEQWVKHYLGPSNLFYTTWKYLLF
jgi:nucleoside phosphorylase